MSRGGRASRDKGNRTERAIVRLLQEHGLAGERVPLSGAARGRFGGDVSVPCLGRDLRGEAKCRETNHRRKATHPRRAIYEIFRIGRIMERWRTSFLCA